MPAGGARLTSAQNSAIVRQGRMTLPAKADAVDHPARMSEPLSLSVGCNIREMPRKVPVKCAIAGCHRRLKMTLGEREELRRMGRENNATAGVVCPAHVRAAFNFEFDDIDIDVPLEEFLVEASKATPRWRVILTPLPEAAGKPDCQPRRGGETGLSSSPAPARSSRGNSGVFRRGSRDVRVPLPGPCSCSSGWRWPPLREDSALGQEELRSLRPALRGDAALG